VSGHQGYRGAGHLPQQRPDGLPADPAGLPRQRRGVTPQMHGRYPDYDVLREVDHWDQRTRAVVLARLDDPPPLRFFDAPEARTLTAFCDMVTAQDSDPRIPLVPLIDAKLCAGELDGFRYAGMPDDRVTWRQVAAGLDEAAQAAYSTPSYADLTNERRHAICERFAKGRLEGGVWERLDVSRAWSVVMRSTLAVFYSHPWAWNEIGFGGPAYPRGFARIGIGQSEAWESSEAFDVDPVGDVAERGLE
jgi:hypothetical protein